MLNQIVPALAQHGNDATAFDLVINTGKVSAEIAVPWIVQAIQALHSPSSDAGPTCASIAVDPILAKTVSDTLSCAIVSPGQSDAHHLRPHHRDHARQPAALGVAGTELPQLRRQPHLAARVESIRSAQVETGALVRAIYKGPGGMQSHVTYRFADVEPGRQLRYVAEPSHPLRGGGTVEILPAPAGCLLHWYGGYDVPWRPAALAAALFTALTSPGGSLGRWRRSCGSGRGEGNITTNERQRMGRLVAGDRWSLGAQSYSLLAIRCWLFAVILRLSRLDHD